MIATQQDHYTCGSTIFLASYGNGQAAEKSSDDSRLPFLSGLELVHAHVLCRPLIGQQGCRKFEKQTARSNIRSWATAQLPQRHDFREKCFTWKLPETSGSKLGIRLVGRGILLH